MFICKLAVLQLIVDTKELKMGNIFNTFLPLLIHCKFQNVVRVVKGTPFLFEIFEKLRTYCIFFMFVSAFSSDLFFLYLYSLINLW